MTNSRLILDEKKKGMSVLDKIKNETRQEELQNIRIKYIKSKHSGFHGNVILEEDAVLNMKLNIEDLENQESISELHLYDVILYYCLNEDPRYYDTTYKVRPAVVLGDYKPSSYYFNILPITGSLTSSNQLKHKVPLLGWEKLGFNDDSMYFEMYSLIKYFEKHKPLINIEKPYVIKKIGTLCKVDRTTVNLTYIKSGNIELALDHIKEYKESKDYEKGIGLE